MKPAIFKAGNFNIVNQASKSVIFINDDGKAVGYPFTGSLSQTWTLSPDGNFWTIQNTLSKGYLGLEVNEKAANGTCVREVKHTFPWRLELHDNHFSAVVPYSNLFLQLSEGKGTLSIILQEGGVEESQRWRLSKPPAPILMDTEIYSVINAHSGTAIELTEDNRAACFQRRSNCDRQQFRAIETGAGWAFKNVATGVYLGLEPTMVRIARGTKVKGVKHEFSWLILPVETASIETLSHIWAPYSGLLMDLHQGGAEDATVIHLYAPSSHNEKPWKRWRFEKAAEGSKSRGAIKGEPKQSI
ncbi:hypothetical protein BKA70DRAFT_1289886 [Coprinopsis sp. MPI-PUGE-AT-0042]|nr:hypothetical protein BKA70DRAFT_1289886 [Coprinopsis sp. MPI-PUGE-AT-0042]